MPKSVTWSFESCHFCSRILFVFSSILEKIYCFEYQAGSGDKRLSHRSKNVLQHCMSYVSNTRTRLTHKFRAHIYRYICICMCVCSASVQVNKFISFSQPYRSNKIWMTRRHLVGTANSEPGAERSAPLFYAPFRCSNNLTGSGRNSVQLYPSEKELPERSRHVRLSYIKLETAIRTAKRTEVPSPPTRSAIARKGSTKCS